MLDRELPTIPFSTEALKANLLRLENEWETVLASRDRNAIYQYLSAVFEIVMVWAQEGKAVKRAHRALHLRGYSSAREPEPFAAVILCTADRDTPDERTRSKWSRVLRYAAEFKDVDEPLRGFIKRKGGINKCANSVCSASWANYYALRRNKQIQGARFPETGLEERSNRRDLIGPHIMTIRKSRAFAPSTRRWNGYRSGRPLRCARAIS
jgi:hypothetical protein